MGETELRDNLVLRLFVYGTLKRGFSNHDLFCSDALDVEEATVRGDLYDLPFGFPALVVPESSIQASGSADYVFDAAEQYGPDSPVKSLIIEGPRVHGEVVTFEDPEEHLPHLDHLEGFEPGVQSLYRRVLLPVETKGEIELAWAYVIERPTGTHLPAGRWPS